MADTINTNPEDCMGWDAEINGSAGSTYELLAEGDYKFEVVDMQRGLTTGTGKLPACNRASLTLRVAPAPGRYVDVRCNLILHRSLEWKLVQFFESIGLKENGKPLAMDWDAVVGASGLGHFKASEYTGSDGRPRKANVCTRSLPAPANAAPAEPAEPEQIELPF